MNLNEIRKEIDQIDRSLLDLFQKRMHLCGQVAAYKKEHHLPVFQAEREQAILQKMEDLAEDGMKSEARELFTVIMDISKQLQQQLLSPVKNRRCSQVPILTVQNGWDVRAVLVPIRKLPSAHFFRIGSLCTTPPSIRYLKPWNPAKLPMVSCRFTTALPDLSRRHMT
jgi:monofunctional chorismate mutase